MLAEALVGRGHNVVVVTLHPGASEKIEERSGIRIYHLPLDNVYWPFTQQAKPNPLLRIVCIFVKCGTGKPRAGSAKFSIWKPQTSSTLTI